MSFKRDGDDKCALSNQRKRRVAELLHEDIEDGELSKLSNGRYVCKLCTHRPIFDTLDMFYVHKRGKKHQLSIEYAEIKKQELLDLIQKRKHEEALNTTTRSGLNNQGHIHEQAGSGSETIVRKHRRKPYDRKPVLDISSIWTPDSACYHSKTTSFDDLPGNRQHTAIPKSSQYNSGFHGNSSIQNLQNTVRPISHDKKRNDAQSDNGHRKNMDKVKRSEASKQACKDDVVNIKDVQKFVGLSNSEQKNKFYLARKSNYSSNNDTIESHTMNTMSGKASSSVMSPNQVWERYKNHKPKNSTIIKPSNEKDKLQESSSKLISDTTHGVPNHIEISQDKRERAEKMLHALRSGWKKDRDGKWIKDDDAEFDSDDEPPDVV